MPVSLQRSDQHWKAPQLLTASSLSRQAAEWVTSLLVTFGDAWCCLHTALPTWGTRWWHPSWSSDSVLRNSIADVAVVLCMQALKSWIDVRKHAGHVVNGHSVFS